MARQDNHDSYDESADAPYDLDVFIDPVCPFCWITTRWIENVRAHREYRVRWRWISLKMINEGTEYSDERYRLGHLAGLHALRVLDAVRQADGNDAVGRVYTEIGNALHVGGRREDLVADTEAFVAEALRAAGYDDADAAKMASHVDDDGHDTAIRAESDLAFERTGGGVGTPILTYRPDGDEPRSFFGPVISKAPRGEEAVRLWQAVETLAGSGVAEIKRSLRDPLDFT